VDDNNVLRRGEIGVFIGILCSAGNIVPMGSVMLVRKNLEMSSCRGGQLHKGFRTVNADGASWGKRGIKQTK